MKIKDLRLTFIQSACWLFFALCAIGISRYLILFFTCKLGWGDPDWGTWLGSIGTITATAGAVWIANDARFQNKAQARALALVTAASFTVRISQLLTTMRSVVGQLDDLDNNFTLERRRWTGNLILHAEAWGPEDAIPLIAIDVHTAALLAQTSSALRAIHQQITAPDMVEREGQIDALTIISDQRMACEELIANLEAALIMCRNVSPFP